MVDNKNATLGEIVFNGTILFISISFTLFPFSIESGDVSPSQSYKFAFFIFAIIVLGISAMLFSFFGIKNNSINLIYWGLVCFIGMVVLMTLVYSQIYTQVVEYRNNLKISK
ncbi:MAG: hypothetical protein AABX00_00670 [Nanoarchaeota archaeon]